MSRKSFRYWTKENFDTSPRSESLVIIELCHFLWDPFILTHEKKVKNCQKLDVQKVRFHEKRYISVNMSPTDLRQVSKFSLVQYLKLFLDTQKNYWVEKTLGEPNFLKKWYFFVSPIRIAQNLPQSLFWLFSAIFHSNWDL